MPDVLEYKHQGEDNNALLKPGQTGHEGRMQMRVGRINACAIGKRRLQRAAGQAKLRIRTFWG